jgi:alginate O-acetyltransferase complex protein AlgI
VLFNSPEFLFAFLPLTLLAVGLLAIRVGRRAGVFGLIVASLGFYAWWKVSGLIIILASIAFNLAIARRLEFLRRKDRHGEWLLAFGVALNLALLGYYKYSRFLLENIQFTDAHIGPIAIVLPLGLSFYTFQQIAFIVDTWRGQVGTISVSEYMVSVLFFPHLIAGPLVHYRDLITQFRSRLTVSVDLFWLGIPIFLVGLAKKVFIADNIAFYVAPLFAKAESAPLEFVSAWIAALGYTAQIYFDFSGYSDMAIGLATMFGIALPVNFRSPYKATSIIDFWRRWHITLSEFLRDYLYIPIGGGRVNIVHRYTNLMVVMLLGGLWHGAGWTFVAWGGLHGGYLVLNHLWRSHVSSRLAPSSNVLLAPFYGVVTFFCVVVAWVFFRALSFSTAANVLSGMAGRTFVSLPGELGLFLSGKVVRLIQPILDGRGMSFGDLVPASVLIVVALTIAWTMPNCAEIFGYDDRKLPSVGRVPILVRAVVVGILAWSSAFGVLGAVPSEFLYFRF